MLIPFTLIAASLLYSLSSSLWTYPHSLAYFNEIVDGPLGGPKHLLNSNIDWGQDMLKLKWWLEKHPEAKTIKINCFGTLRPNHLNMDQIELEAERHLEGKKSEGIYSSYSTIPHGWYAISINKLYGYERRGEGSNNYSGFREITPSATLGYSINIYHVSK